MNVSFEDNFFRSLLDLSQNRIYREAIEVNPSLPRAFSRVVSN